MYTAKEAVEQTNISKNANIDKSIIQAIKDGHTTVSVERKDLSSSKHIELLKLGYTIYPHKVKELMVIEWLP